MVRFGETSVCKGLGATENLRTFFGSKKGQGKREEKAGVGWMARFGGHASGVAVLGDLRPLIQARPGLRGG